MALIRPIILCGAEKWPLKKVYEMFLLLGREMFGQVKANTCAVNGGGGQMRSWNFDSRIKM